jgi:hypothetical protein
MPKTSIIEFTRSKNTMPPTTTLSRTPTTSPSKKEEENSDLPRPPPKNKTSLKPKTPNPLKNIQI